MAFNKLTEQLQAFDKPLLKKLSIYLTSPYFNVAESALQFFNYLEKLHPHFEEKKLTEEAIAKKEPALFDYNKQAKAATKLLQAIEHFLAVEQFEKQPAHQTLYLLKGLQHLKLHEAFETTAQEFEEQLAACPEKDIDYFNYLHRLTELKHNSFEARLQRNHKNDLLPVTQTLDTFYALKKLRYHCELLSRHQVLGIAYDKENVAELLQLLQPYTTAQYPYVYLFVHVYQMMRATGFEEGQKHYQLLHTYIEQANYTTLPQGGIEATGYLINYCLHWNNLGYKKAGAGALYWYQLKINHNRFIENGRIQPSDFRNIVSLSVINNHNPNWLLKFIETYAPYLPAEHAPTNLAFAQAQYFYYVKKYEAAMPLFQQAQAKDEPIFNMIVRRWQFMCMYEQNPKNQTVLLDFVASWERSLHRQAEGLQHYKDVFAKVISYCKKLLAANQPEQKLTLAQTLHTEPFFAGKDWLLAQLQVNQVSQVA
jgi:hypothetical protein